MMKTIDAPHPPRPSSSSSLRQGVFKDEDEGQGRIVAPTTPGHPSGRPSSVQRWGVFICVIHALFLQQTSWAQPIITAPRPTSTNQPDPLAAFMVSQPPIDSSSPITPTVEFEPAVITNGQQSVYRVVLNVMEQSVEWPHSIPTPEGCSIRQGASGQFLRSLGSTIVPKTTFLYHVQPQSNGTFTLPSYTVRARGETVRIPAATLTVVPPGSKEGENTPRIELTADGTEFFVGQNIGLEATFQGKPNGTARTLSQVNVVGEGLIVDRNYRAQRIEMRVENGVTLPTFIYSLLVTPMRHGQAELTVHGYALGNRSPRQISISGPGMVVRGQAEYRLVDSEPMIFNILPLPRESQLPGFTGAIGSFTADPPTLSTNHVRAGDLITLRLTLRGNGNLERVLPPEIDHPPEWQVFPPTPENILPAIIRQRGYVTFDYKLIPLDDRLKATPPIPLCYFDPDTRRYVDLTVPTVPITVDPSPSLPSLSGQPSLIETRSLLRELLNKPDKPTALADLTASQGRTTDTFKPAHRQTGFAATQLLPATLLGGLWFRDRRRRFLELHPEILIRRRARKAIRRHARCARKAARNGDTREFLQQAIQAFRAACAPAPPADPQALVCDDILNMLPDGSRQQDTAHVVTKLFTAANEWRFGDVQPDSRELLGLSREVDQRLKELRCSL